MRISGLVGQLISARRPPVMRRQRASISNSTSRWQRSTFSKRLANGRFRSMFEQRYCRRIDQNQFVEPVDRQDRFGESGENRFDLFVPRRTAPEANLQYVAALLGISRGFRSSRRTVR